MKPRHPAPIEPAPVRFISPWLLFSGISVVAVQALVAQPAPTSAETTAPASVNGEVVTLDPFTIQAETSDGYFAKSTTPFGRVVMSLENIPQKVDVFNADIVPTTLSDSTRYSTVVNYANSKRNNSNVSLVRGFVASVRRNGENLGDLVGLAGIETIEQVEVVKGPSAVLYGASRPGGVINYVAVGRLWIPQHSLRRINDVSPRVARNQFDLTGMFATGPVKHTVLIGTELSLGEKSRYAPYGGSTPGSTTRFAYEGAAGRAYATWVDTPDSARSRWTGTTFGPPQIPTTIRLQPPTPSVPQDDIAFEIPYLTEEPDSYYIFDPLSLFEERLQISFGLRHDDIQQQYRDASGATREATSSQWTSRAGFVYKVRPWLHAYALYNESFNPNPTGTLNAWRAALDPQDGEQREAGVRLNLWGERIAVDASYFEISNKNVYQSDPFGKLPTRFPPGTDLNNVPDTVLWPNTPGLENKGFDIDVKIRVSRDTQVLIAYTHNDMVATGTTTQQEALGSETYPVNNVPDEQFSFWGKGRRRPVRSAISRERRVSLCRRSAWQPGRQRRADCAEQLRDGRSGGRLSLPPLEREPYRSQRA